MKRAGFSQSHAPPNIHHSQDASPHRRRINQITTSTITPSPSPPGQINPPPLLDQPTTTHPESPPANPINPAARKQFSNLRLSTIAHPLPPQMRFCGRQL